MLLNVYYTFGAVAHVCVLCMLPIGYIGVHERDRWGQILSVVYNLFSFCWEDN